MSKEEILLLCVLISKWRKHVHLTHAQRNWLEDMQIAALETVIARANDYSDFVPPF